MIGIPPLCEIDMKSLYYKVLLNKTLAFNCIQKLVVFVCMLVSLWVSVFLCLCERVFVNISFCELDLRSLPGVS